MVIRALELAANREFVSSTKKEYLVQSSVTDIEEGND